MLRSRPGGIAAAVMKGLAAGASEVISDDASRRVKTGFNATPSAYLATAAG